MKRVMAIFIAAACLAAGTACKIEHTKTVVNERDGGQTTEHSVQVKEIVSGQEKGVEVYNSRDEMTREEREAEEKRQKAKEKEKDE